MFIQFARAVKGARVSLGASLIAVRCPLGFIRSLGTGIGR